MPLQLKTQINPRTTFGKQSKKKSSWPGRDSLARTFLHISQHWDAGGTTRRGATPSWQSIWHFCLLFFHLFVYFLHSWHWEDKERCRTQVRDRLFDNCRAKLDNGKARQGNGATRKCRARILRQPQKSMQIHIAHMHRLKQKNQKMGTLQISG